MHPDLPKLLQLQEKDQRLREAQLRRSEIAAELAEHDSALAQAEHRIEVSRRSLADAATRRDEREQRLEALRAMQQKRRSRLEEERNPRVAAQLMADVEAGRSLMAQEESDWMRVAEEATEREKEVASNEAELEALRAEQAEIRSQLAERDAEEKKEHDAALAERETAAEELDPALRTRYDRLLASRDSAVLVPAVNATCTACYTAIPRSRVGKLQADGLLLEGCEMCGAILYVEEVAD